jgi:molybdenum cofactor cytidylyltransferase
MMATAALILSGGESSRFGGYPKALLSTGDRSAVRRLSDICLVDGFDPVVVVVGAHHLPIAHELRDLEVSVVVADRWREGRTASLQAGLEAIPEDRDILFWPVDHAFVAPRTIDTLLSARDADLLGVWFIPTYEGRGGHPVLWRSTMRANLFELRPDAPVRALLPEYGPQVRRVAVEDPGVVANVDTPETYRLSLEAFRARGEFL